MSECFHVPARISGRSAVSSLRTAVKGVPRGEAGLILLPKEEIAARRVHFPWDGKMLPAGDAAAPRG
ncbi:hypothetical protein CP972_05930 [Streptomyces prasinus]|uniref:Uncharacterized protein n=1 Tax=Streptomyces prasinus TaxID=67345 RepID=A0ABX6AU87_9ACTN|nr:hypothetical protein CP972_05930 [Streptomyces prasinus]